MLSKERITEVRFSDLSCAPDPQATPTPASPAASSNISTHLLTSSQICQHHRKGFSKSLIASLTSKTAEIKEVCDYIPNDNAERLKQIFRTYTRTGGISTYDLDVFLLIRRYLFQTFCKKPY